VREASSCDNNGIEQYSCALKLQNQSLRSIASSKEQGNGTEGFDGASLASFDFKKPQQSQNRRRRILFFKSEREDISMMQ
jgi:hypothetical protein